MAIKKDFTQGNIWKQMILFAIPIILTSILNALFLTADLAVIGNFGGETVEAREIELDGIGCTGSILSLSFGLFDGLALGAGVVLARAIGAKKNDRIADIVHTSVTFSVLCGVFVMIVGFFLSRPILILTRIEEPILTVSNAYLKTRFAGAPGQVLYAFCAALLRADGDAVRPLWFLTSSGVLNVILNLVFVLCFGMGAVGVGLASTISIYFSAVWALLYMMVKPGNCHVDFRRLQIHPEQLKRIVKIGLPNGICSCMFAIPNMMIQGNINTFGPSVIAGNSAAGNLVVYIDYIETGFKNATITFVGQNVGAKNIERIKKSVRVALTYAISGCAVVGALMLIFAEPLLSVYLPGNAPAITAGRTRVLITASTYAICAVYDMMLGGLIGLGKTIPPMVVNVIGICVYRVVWMATVFRVFRYPMTLYVTWPISWVTCSVALFFLFKKYLRLRAEKIRLSQETAPSPTPTVS